VSRRRMRRQHQDELGLLRREGLDGNETIQRHVDVDVGLQNSSGAVIIPCRGVRRRSCTGGARLDETGCGNRDGR